MTSLPENTKVCTMCGQELPATKEYFYASKDGKYGLRSKCKACMAMYRHQWREETQSIFANITKKIGSAC